MGRIIAGSARGARLQAPLGQNTRPTTDRVREALFSALVTWADGADSPAQEQLQGLAVLDLFAGSGAIGLEAASRGAVPVTLVEQDRNVVAIIRANAEASNLKANVIASTVERYVALPAARPHDIVVMDPPYALSNEELQNLVSELWKNSYLLSDGLLVVERSSRDPEPMWPTGIECSWSRRYGETCLYFCRPIVEKSSNE